MVEQMIALGHLFITYIFGRGIKPIILRFQRRAYEPFTESLF